MWVVHFPSLKEAFEYPHGLLFPLLGGLLSARWRGYGLTPPSTVLAQSMDLFGSFSRFG